MCLSKKELLNLIEKKYSPAFLPSSGESALHNMLYVFLSNPFAELIVDLGGGLNRCSHHLFKAINQWKIENGKWKKNNVMLNLFQHLTSLAFSTIIDKILNLVQDDILTMEGSLCFP